MKLKERIMAKKAHPHLIEDVPINIQCIHKSHEPSPAFESYAREKMQKLAEHYRIHKIMLICEVYREKHYVKAVVTLPKRHVNAIQAESEDLYATVDLLVPKITNYCQHYHGKLGHFKHNPISRDGG